MEVLDKYILGKWSLVKTIEEEYHPVSTLVYHDEYIGLPGDSIVFKPNGLAYSYEDGDTQAEETEYHLLNDSTVSIEDEIYKIRKLSDTEYYFHQEEIEISFDEKWIYEVYLKR